MKKLLNYFINDSLLVNLIFVIIVIAGIFCIKGINREIFPATDMDAMVINIAYPGASARDVELNALVPVEQVLDDISGIDHYSSNASDGNAHIFLEIDDEIANSRMVMDEIHRKVSLSSVSDLAEDVEAITISEMNAKRIPVVRYALVPNSDAITTDELYDMADVLERILEKTEGVSSVTKDGYLDKQVHINVNPDKMEKFFVSISEIVSSISVRNIRSSGGQVNTEKEERNIVTIGEFENPLDVGDVIIRSGFEQGKVTVSDIADVDYGYEDTDTKIRANGFETVVLTVTKKETADSINTVDAVAETLEKNRDIYGKDFSVVQIMNTAESISSQIDIVVTNALIGFALVALVLLVFLDFRTSFWTAISIPLCLLMVMIFLMGSGFTINIISLGAIITVLGMLVDDAIVVAETIYSKKEQGMNPKQAALDGIREVIAPVTVTIISTIVAFLPLTMVQGRMGKFIFIYPIIISVTLLSSLGEATFLLPNHLASHGGKAHKEKRWFNALKNGYKKALNLCIIHRYMVLTGFVLLLIFSIVLSVTGMKKFQLRNESVSDEITLNLTAHTEITLDKMEDITAVVEKKIKATVSEDEFKSMMTYVGKHANAHGEGNHVNWATVNITLVPVTERKRDTRAIIGALRNEINTETYPDFTDIVFKESVRGPDTGSAVDVKVISSNEEHIEEVVSKLNSYLSTIDGVKDISDDMQDAKNEVHIVFDYDKLSALGLTAGDVSSTIRTAYNGTEATAIQQLDKRLEFNVSLEEKFKNDPNRILELLVPNSSGNLVRLGDVAGLEMVKTQNSIRHYNGERSISVSAGVDMKKITPMQANMKVMKEFENISHTYPDVVLDFQGEMRETRTALSGLTIAFIAAILLIYVLILFLFRSVGQPFIVLSVVPFGLIGVLLAFKFYGVTLTFMAIVGIIGLSGVVINDSIIMVEFINKMMAKSSDRESIMKAILDGASQRLRPIILTTVTTVAGLLPTAHGWGGDAGTLVPTVMAMAYGLLFATLLTLFFVPALYMIGNDLQHIMGLKRRH